jgi:hypothetical protein
MASMSLVARPRRSTRIAVKNFKVADADAERFMEAARAIWEQGLEMPPHVLELDAIARASEAQCTPAAKRLLAAFVSDQPLPGYLEELRHLGTLWDAFSLEGVLSEIEALLLEEEEAERADNHRFLEQISEMGLELHLI